MHKNNTSSIPRPKYFWTNFEPINIMKVVVVWCTTAFARTVFVLVPLGFNQTDKQKSQSSKEKLAVAKAYEL